ncbi:hypothetical protein [Cupriavidus sp. D384]|uniref:hypothetical protein n=1 Tax=Cupriavidus sp. D384 TaxID=1538095 RepID=UPI00082E64DD|nr:hypothetical protein [Cupriavidus sp. D384]
MPAVKLSPIFNNQVVNDAGAPASGWKVYTYAAGSSTPLATYTDSAGTVPQSNPVIINALGFPTNGPIWLQSGLAYKFVLTDASDVVKKTIDNVAGVNDTSSTVSQWQASGQVPTYVSANSFTLSGDQTSEFHVGRRLQFTTTAGTVYGTIISSAFTTLTTVTMSMDAPGVLDSGLSTVNLSILRADKNAVPTTNLPLSCRNKLTNARFNINQRLYVSGTNTTAANQYTIDGVKVVTSGQNVAFVASGNHFTLTAPDGGFEMPVEAINIEGGTYYLNWLGTATATVNGTAVAKGGGIVVAANTAVAVRFSNGTVELPQFKLNGVSPFDGLPDALELVRCQRWLRVAQNQTGHCVSANGVFMYIQHPGMRAIPTITVNVPIVVGDALANYTQSAANVAISANQRDSGVYACGNFTGMTVGRFVGQTSATFYISAEP